MNLVNRHIKILEEKIEVDLNHPVARYSHNPILQASDVNKVWTAPRRQVTTVHNAGICWFGRQTIMLFRSHLRNGISVIGLARSNNGITDWEIDPEPAMMPCTKENLFDNNVDVEKQIANEAGGVEDPRISKLEDTYYITYSAYHGQLKDHVRVCLATTKDFKKFIRYGEMIDRDMRNVVIFPERFDNKYVALMRPNDEQSLDVTGGIYKEIRFASSDDIISGNWEVDPESIMKQEGGPSAFGDKIGPGTTPLKSKYGWINIFHGVRATMDGNPYVLGVAVHDLKDPKKLRVSNIPVLFPSEADCNVSKSSYVHVPHVVFTCGALINTDGSIFIYYGGNDTVMNVGITHEDVLYELCKNYPQDPVTGIPGYQL